MRIERRDNLKKPAEQLKVRHLGNEPYIPFNIRPLIGMEKIRYKFHRQKLGLGQESTLKLFVDGLLRGRPCRNRIQKFFR